ncbi:MAG: nucleoside phosphorylase [Flavobacteriales bacterium]|nr:nucleoside phosphorylase [Flavobacteriales bacterium]
MHAVVRQSNLPIPETELILRNDGSVYHLGIKEEHVADKVIIVGDPDRVPLISAFFDEIDTRISGREFVIHTGSYQGKRITVVSSGIGVDNIDIVINELDAAVNVDLKTRKPKSQWRSLEIIRIGTSGSMHADIPPGSFVSSVFAFGLDGVPYSYESSQNNKEIELHNILAGRYPWLRESSGFYTVQGSKSLMDRVAFDTVQGITATANGFYGPQGRSVRLQSVMEKRIDEYAQFNHEGLKITNFEMECAGIYALSSMLGHQALTICAILANRATKEFHKNPSASIESLIRLVLERF